MTCREKNARISRFVRDTGNLAVNSVDHDTNPQPPDRTPGGLPADPGNTQTPDAHTTTTLATGSLPAGHHPSFEQQLLQGHYTGILETYGVKWTLARAARDTLQNFYDAEGSLANVDFTI